MTEVPDVTHLTRLDATSELISRGFRVRVKTKPSENEGLVVDQNPWPGDPAPDDMLVTIWIGTALSPEMPDMPVREETTEPDRMISHPDIGEEPVDHWKKAFPGHQDPFS